MVVKGPYLCFQSCFKHVFLWKKKKKSIRSIPDFLFLNDQAFFLLVGFPGGASGKESVCLPIQETQDMQVQSLGQEDPLKKKITTRSSILLLHLSLLTRASPSFFDYPIHVDPKNRPICEDLCTKSSSHQSQWPPFLKDGWDHLHKTTYHSFRPLVAGV